MSDSSSAQISFFHKFALADSSNEGSSVDVSTPVLSPTSNSPIPSSSVQYSSLDPLSSQSSYSSSSLEPAQTTQPIYPSQSTHPMITRAKVGIFKPKTYLAVIQDLEPTSVKATLQNSKWH